MLNGESAHAVAVLQAERSELVTVSDDELEQLAEILPRRLRDILQQVDAGKFDVHLDHRGLEPSVNRLVLGMMTSALFLVSSILISMDVWAIRGVSVPGTLGALLRAFVGWRLGAAPKVT